MVFFKPLRTELYLILAHYFVYYEHKHINKCFEQLSAKLITVLTTLIWKLWDQTNISYSCYDIKKRWCRKKLNFKVRKLKLAFHVSCEVTSTTETTRTWNQMHVINEHVSFAIIKRVQLSHTTCNTNVYLARYPPTL